MGYSISHKGYVCYDPSSNKFRTCCNVVFFENQYYFSTHVKSLPELSVLPCYNELPPLLNGSNPELHILDVNQLCPLSSLILPPHLIQCNLRPLSMTWLLHLVLDALHKYHTLLIGMVLMLL